MPTRTSRQPRAASAPARRSRTAALARAVDTPRITQAERRETAEHAILEAAKGIVAEHGFDALTLNAAGEAAGYSRALPAHYFKTRDALVAALADHIMSTYAVRVREDVGPHTGLEQLLERVALYIDGAVADPTSIKAFFAILGAAKTRPEMGPLMTRLNRASIDGLAIMIRAGREAGKIRADARPRAEASIIIAAMRGVVYQWLIDPGHVKISRVRDCLIANIRKSLAR